jgi:superfamily II DNA or RNA helicase
MSAFNWQIGDRVVVRDGMWTIDDGSEWSDCTLLRLIAAAGEHGARVLGVPFDRPSRLPPSKPTRLVRPRRWLHEVRRMGAGLVPFGGAKIAARLPLALLPHQLEPLVAVLRYGATRLLIADAVGLGKTIQAGLILSELSARIDDFRAIVLVPAGLRDQWRQELHSWFDLTVSDADAAWLRVSADLPVDMNPWSLPGVFLTSIDFAKRPEVRRAIEDTTWDVMVLDEAHLASASSDRRAVAHAIGSRSRRTVLLTATPESSDDAAFASLAGIGAVAPDEPPVRFFRRTRAEIAGSAPRRSLLLRVHPTAAERRMHDLLERYTSDVWKESRERADNGARLAAIVLRKRALSSAASLAVSAQRRLDLLAGTAAAGVLQLLLPLADEDPLPDDVSDLELAAPGLADARRERRWLAGIVDAAREAARAESKTTRLVRLLGRIREPVLVFTEYRDTLQRLERVIRSTGRRLTILHGGMERRQRRSVQAEFNAGGLTLLATDAAAEGLNLHHHCRVVVHYELPWRPARAEQRAGRVDRFGQRKRVHEIALVAAGTAERLVLGPLAVRAARARAAGDAAAGWLDSLTEASVSDHVMDAVPLPGPAARQPLIQVVTHLRREAESEVERLTRTRQWLSASPRLEARTLEGVVYAVIAGRHSALPPGLLLVFTQRLLDAEGRCIHAEPLVTTVATRRGAAVPRRAVEIRRLIGSLVGAAREPAPEIGARLAVERDTIVTRVTALRGAAARETRQRVMLMLSGAPGDAPLVQAGLFDRRALVNRAREQLRRDAEREATARLERALDPGAALVARTELVAVLAVAGRT